jgi:hypothetical protein
MSCQNMRIQDWTDEQLEKGVVQLHIQRLHANGNRTRIRHGESVTIHTVDREGLFNEASVAVVKLSVVRSHARSDIKQEGPLVDPARKRRVKT